MLRAYVWEAPSVSLEAWHLDLSADVERDEAAAQKRPPLCGATAQWRPTAHSCHTLQSPLAAWRWLLVMA